MLNEQGYYRPTYDEIVEEKIQTAIKLFGEDIDTSELTPLGKFIRMDAYVLAKAYEDLEAVYYARFPNTAMGTSLDRLCVFAGISRNPATPAQHTIRVYSSEATDTETEIGIGELVVCGEDNDITFYTANTYTLPPNGGSVEMIVECAEAGTVGNVAIITDVVNPLAEVDRIEYIGIAELGKDVESDYDLRKRFSVVITGSGSSNINAIRAALLKVPEVNSASVIVNDTDDVDAEGRPPRSFECYVYGGEDYEQEIAEAIFDKAPIGISTCSTSDSPVVKEVLDAGGYPHTVKFSHTEKVNIIVEIFYKKNDNFEEDGETQIKNKIVEYINGLGVGTDVVATSLYSHIYSVPGVTDATIIDTATDTASYYGNNIEINEWQVAQTTAALISLEVAK